MVTKRKTKPKKVHTIDCDLGVDCMCSPSKLEDLMRLCRRFGVLVFKQEGLEISFAAMLAEDPAPVAPSTPEAQPEVGVKEQRRGADGLTAEQQEELLGRVMDAKG